MNNDIMIIYIHEYSTALDSESDSKSGFNLILIPILNLIPSILRIGIKFKDDSESDSESNSIEYS